jgi:hypothetical protein
VSLAQISSGGKRFSSARESRFVPIGARPSYALYALRMRRLRTLLERLPGGHRPPTGPLTTAEQTDAEELRQETLVKDNERIEREQEDGGDRRDREV